MVQAYSFPILDRREIVAYLLESGIGLELEEQQLLKPTMEVIWPLYESLVHSLMGISREELKQPAFHAVESLEYPELHEESVGCVASIRAIMKLMFAAGAQEFSMKDIFKPESKRTITFLSAIINYAKFREEKEATIALMQDDRDRTLSEIQQLEEQIAVMNSEVETIEAERRAQQPAVKALEAENKELERRMQIANKQHGTLQSQIRCLKQDANTVSDAIATENFLGTQAKQEQAQLRAQIVQSPEKLQKAVGDKKVALQNAEAAAEVAKQTLEGWRAKTESYSKAQKKVRKFLSMIDEMEKLSVVQKATVKEVKALKAKAIATEEHDQSLKKKLAELMIQGQYWQQAIEKLERQGPIKLQEEDQEMEEEKSRNAALMVQHQTRAAAVAKRNAQALRMREQLQEAYENKDAIIAEGTAAISEVQQMVFEHYHTLLEGKDSLPRRAEITAMMKL
ncbi:unnamed protein product [Sphagnum jensenii]|uniref:Kinetochore protein Nuf2 N-terminal domain-containing protein n=1 Tax=Sphagnum jensenii TaxID=128206 RepID=A0ABP0WEC3_9BRYO